MKSGYSVLLAAAVILSACTRETAVTTDEARAIAREAYIYGFPLVDNYRITYAYYVDSTNPEYRGGWNTVHNTARVYTPADKAVQTPNSDTPYSMVGIDLRAEPLVFTVPAIEEGRYYSLQFIDLNTFNYHYVGSRTTGNKGGKYLLVGPNWKGEKPEGIDEVIRSATDLGGVIYRTQLFNPADIEKVKAIQAGYKLEPLSTYLGTEAPMVKKVAFIEPLSKEEGKSSLEFFRVLNFLLGFIPTDPSETELMARFAKIGVGPGLPFDTTALSPAIRTALHEGIADAWKEFGTFKEKIDRREVTSGELFGTREYLKNDYLRRMGGAVLGIYGNSKEEAIYPAYAVDSDGKPLDGANKYTLRLAKDSLPPVNAFWSLTMYEMPASLLVENPLNRYLLNSTMLSQFKRDPDGGITFYIQHDSPGKAREANWLPAPKGPFAMAMRLYWPKDEALGGAWKAPAVIRQ